MRKIIFLFILVFSSSAFSQGELLRKTKDLVWLESFYQELKKINETETSEVFCKEILLEYDYMLLRVSNDSDLILKLLKNSPNQDIKDYAQDLSSNAMSVAFYANYLKDKCKMQNEWDKKKTSESLEKSLINNRYLQMTHNLFMQAYCEELKELCSY